jgi:tetratricopeptide (TPR) repeat protein
MLSPKRSTTSNLATDRSEVDSFIALNQEEFQFLLAFVGMSKEFKIAFAEINFPPDNDNLIAALALQSSCQNVQFAVINVDNPDLHFLLSELKIEVAAIEREPEKKLVLIIRGLEKSIRTTGDYPNVLANLNYARDSFTVAIPHPIIFLLPDYAVTRFALFAPDFWAWTAATFKFQTTQVVLDQAIEQYQIDPGIRRTYAKPERRDRIELLERLLQEYPEETEASGRARLEVLNQLGEAHKSTRDFETASIYFEQALELSHELAYTSGEANALDHLGDIAYNLRKFDQADTFFKHSLILKEKIGDRQSTGSNYHFLGMVAQQLRQWEDAWTNYLQALAIFEEFNDLYSQAGIYGQLGIIASELHEWEDARTNYRQALSIFEGFNDRHSQAKTYHRLGIVAQVLREWEDARTNYRQALNIKEEFNDQYAQASTYGQLGLLAESEGNLAEATKNLEQALEIFTEFKDEHSMGMTISNLARIASAQQESASSTVAK